MSQHDYVIDNAAGATVRADLNNALAAQASRNSGTSAPSTTYANMVWVDTTNHLVKERNEANSAWIIRGRTDAEGVLAKTALYTLALRDFGKIIDATSGTWTLTLMAAATATDGFWFDVRNSGTGVITIDGDSSETIDGLTTIEVNPGEFVRVQCNGTLWRSSFIHRMGSLPENIQTDTYTITTADRGKLCIANKATAMTFNLPAAATAGKGFVLFYKNIGAGALTIDGNASETIDGSTTKTVVQNESGALECDGSNWRTILTGSSSKLVQRVYATYTTYTSTATAIPADNTIPQNTEGAETVTASITPTNASNIIRVTAIANTGGSTSIEYAAALFRDSVADALDVAPGFAGGSGVMDQPLTIVFEETAGSVSARTYKLRCGPASGTLYFNGDNASRLYGGICKHTLMIEELMP